MFVSFARVIKYGWVNFSRNRGLTGATLFIMVMMISLVTGLLVGQEFFAFLTSRVKEKVDISVYFARDSAEEDILNIAQELEVMPQIKEVEYVSKDAALERFSQRHQNDDEIIESLNEVGDDPLPPSLNITTYEAVHYAQVSSFLRAAPFKNLINKIDYVERKPIIERVFSLTSQINTTGTILFILFGVVAAIVIYNQISMTIKGSKEEIKVMRLVGAPNWLIQGPFLVQGIIIGALAAIITFFISALAVFLLSSRIALVLPGFSLLESFKDGCLIIFLAQAVTGIGLGIISSLIATRKYLKI